MGECAHSYLTRWLEGDTAIVLSSMETFSGKDDMSLEDAEKLLRTEKRQGRPMEVPAASAWKTLQAIRAKHAQQRASKKRKQDAFLQQSWQVFRNGMASADIADPELLGNARILYHSRQQAPPKCRLPFPVSRRAAVDSGQHQLPGST